MLTHEDIRSGVQGLAGDYPIVRVSYFGSYADGRATDGSDLDVLVEFATPAVSLLTLLEIKYRLEDALEVPVDVVHAPVPEGSLLEVCNEVPVYAA
ncbi:MAG: nucleotidyltransferase domain-containing protein [Coriobacteriales bacterium]|jgi:predicted nucleotidyltransferase|nr:nucleotidyltransferase domain-containing protein [Coriobacteriales bacterium]